MGRRHTAWNKWRVVKASSRRCRSPSHLVEWSPNRSSMALDPNRGGVLAVFWTVKVVGERLGRRTFNNAACYTRLIEERVGHDEQIRCREESRRCRKSRS
jgi:hypothetical protein